MAENDNKPVLKLDLEGFDPVGLKSFGELSKEATKFGIEAARLFLNATCKPLLEEFGLIMRDKITHWKLNNILKMLEKAQGKLLYDAENNNLKINPRVAYQIVENTSTIEDDNLQEMWAGLFAASCNTAEDDENIFFIDILNRLTSAQVKLLNFICTSCKKHIEIGRLPDSLLDGDIELSFISMTYEDILTNMGTQSRLKADSEFSQLESMGLLQVYFRGTSIHMSTIQKIKTQKSVNIKPLTTALRLFVKCQGSILSPVEYFLPEILDYYHSVLDGTIELPKNEIMAFLEAQVKKDNQRTVQISWNENTFNVKTEDAIILSKEDLTTILRPMIIKHHLQNIGKVMEVSVNNELFGKFDYKYGFTALYGQIK